MKAPWTFSTGLSAVALIVALIVIPAVAQGNPFLVALVPIGRTFGLFFAAVFGLIAAGKLLMLKRGAGGTTPRSVAVRSSSMPPAGAARIARETVPVPYGRRHVKEDAARAWPDPHLAQVLDGAAPPLTSEAAPPAPASWSLELLQSLDWKRFEEVVAAYFREKGFRSETIACGPDGGVDVRLFFREDPKPAGIVQCKAWSTRQVGVAQVRELLGVMAHENMRRGYFAATGTFSEDAIAFASANHILLISETDLLTAIARMEPARGAALLAAAVEGDYTTPSCPSCGAKLYRRKFKSGSAAWVCKGYPKCQTRIWTKAT